MIYKRLRLGFIAIHTGLDFPAPLGAASAAQLQLSRCNCVAIWFVNTYWHLNMLKLIFGVVCKCRAAKHMRIRMAN